MRLLPKRKLQVKGKVVGGEQPLLCLPLQEREAPAVLAAAHALKVFAPDMVEWRIDGFEELHNREKCLEIVGELRTILPEEIPLLLTCRTKVEGGQGYGALSPGELSLLFGEIIGSGNIDLVDIELGSSDEFVEYLCRIAKEHNVKTLFSYHNFTETPAQAELVDIMRKMQDGGADIAKLAVMPHGYGDVLTLLGAVHEARQSAVDIPLVAIAMGEEGKISRLSAGLFGADIIFVRAADATAPGQLHITDMRRMMRIFYEGFL